MDIDVDEDKVIEAVDWIEKAAKAADLPDRAAKAVAGGIRQLTAEATQPLTSDLKEFSGSYIECEVVTKIVDRRVVVPKPTQWKIVFGATIALREWQRRLRLNDKEIDLFREYVPTIPNDYYTAVKIKLINGIEILAVEQHHILGKGDSALLTRNTQQLTHAIRGIGRVIE